MVIESYPVIHRAYYINLPVSMDLRAMMPHKQLLERDLGFHSVFDPSYVIFPYFEGHQKEIGSWIECELLPIRQHQLEMPRASHLGHLNSWRTYRGEKVIEFGKFIKSNESKGWRQYEIP